MDEIGWNVTEAAARLGCERGTLSRLLNGKAAVPANMARALEALGWGTVDHWMRTQATSLRRREGRADGGRTRGRGMRSGSSAVDSACVLAGAGGWAFGRSGPLIATRVG